VLPGEDSNPQFYVLDADRWPRRPFVLKASTGSGEGVFGAFRFMFIYPSLCWWLWDGKLCFSFLQDMFLRGSVVPFPTGFWTGCNTATLTRPNNHHFPTLSLEHLNLSIPNCLPSPTLLSYSNLGLQYGIAGSLQIVRRENVFNLQDMLCRKCHSFILCQLVYVSLSFSFDKICLF
jgi:hypothetical protein